MGITIIQKSNLNQIKGKPKISLVLAGGAVSGAAFKIGGLKALNDFLVNRKLVDFDIYVGLSAGAILSVPLCGGIPPEEMLRSLDGRSKIFSQAAPFDMYSPNIKEFFTRPVRFAYNQASFLPGALFDVLRASPHLHRDFLENVKDFIKSPSYSNYENLTKPILNVAYRNRHIPSFGELLPSGIFTNKRLAHYLRQNMIRNKMPNSFRVLKRMTGKSLYITAMNLDTAERVVFGPDEKNDIDITDAVQASSAIPGFYKPARIKGVDYIDGGVRKTANIDLAIEKGADLVICYNPFRPYNNEIFLEYIREENRYITKRKRLSDWGLGTVLNQVFRTLFHSRLEFGLKNLENDPNFNKDIILVEPSDDDNDFFTLNPLFFWNRAKAAKLGFDSVTDSITQHYDQISKILDAYGIQMTRDVIDEDLQKIERAHFDDNAIMEVLEQPHRRIKKRLKVLNGGRK